MIYSKWHQHKIQRLCRYSHRLAFSQRVHVPIFTFRHTIRHLAWCNMVDYSITSQLYRNKTIADIGDSREFTANDISIWMRRNITLTTTVQRVLCVRTKTACWRNFSVMKCWKDLWCDATILRLRSGCSSATARFFFLLNSVELIVYSRNKIMPKVKRSRKPPPDGWELIEPTLDELDQKMREGLFYSRRACQNASKR